METAVEVALVDAWGRSIPFHQTSPRLRTRRPRNRIRAHIHLRRVRAFSRPGNASVFEKVLFLYPLPMPTLLCFACQIFQVQSSHLVY
jgi:hypothetical protein